MTTLAVVLALFVLLPLAASVFGTDSRNLQDHDWEVPWNRLPR